MFSLLQQAARLVLVVACFLFLSQNAYADSCVGLTKWQQVSVDEDDLLIGLVRVNAKPLSSGFDVYPAENTYLIPLQSLEDLLQLGWQINQISASLHSNYSIEKPGFCDFNLDLTKVSDDQESLYWTQDDFDIYIDIRAISLLVGGSAVFNFELQQLQIITDTFIPGIVDGHEVYVPSFTAYQEKVPDRVISDAYRLNSMPIINYRLAARYDSKRKKTRLTTNLNSFFDLAHHATEVRVNNSNGNTKQFLRLSKNLDITGENEAINYLRYEFGDILLQGDELVSRAKQAAGVAVFNFDPNYSRSFSQVTIEETVLPGWRAQLFRNGQFLAETFTSDDNRVVFENIATFYGNNLFEIKLYGPEGQQEVRQQTLNVGNEQLSPDSVNYYFSVSDASIRTIDDNANEAKYDKNITGLVSYGLAPNATVEASFHSLRGLDVENNYVSTSAYLNIENTAIKTQIVKDIDAGSAFFTGLSTSFGTAFKAKISSRLFNNFSSDAYQASQNLKSETRIGFNGRSDLFGGFGWNGNILNRNFQDLPDSSSVTIAVNKNLLGGTFSSSLTHNSSLQNEKLLHRIYWSKNILGWRLSNSLEWLPMDDQKIRNYYTNIRWPQKYNTFNETRIDYKANQDDKFSVSHKFNWRRDEFNLQFGATLDTGGHWNLNFGISGDIDFGFSDNKVNFYRPRGNNLANIQAFAFLDNNRNSVFDESDTALADVSLTGNQGWKNNKTDSNGKVQLSTNNRSQLLKIDEATLPDPFMQAVDELILVNTHKGGINEVHLPVVTFSDFEGAVYLVKGNNSKGIGGITITFKDELGETVSQTQTEIDGYFFVSGLAPGNYVLELDPEYLQQNNLEISNMPNAIVAPKEGDSIRLDDLLIESKAV